LLFCIAVAPVMAAVGTSSSTGATVDTQQLLQIIEQQQQRLDAQAAQLAAQQEALQKLHTVVEELKNRGTAGSVPQAAVAGATGGASLKAPDNYKTAGAAKKEEWPGFYAVPGTNTQFKVGGYVELDAIYDNHDVATPAAFVTSAIPTHRSGAAKAENGQTNFSVQATRFSLETRTPLANAPDDSPRRVTTFFSFDLFNDFLSTTPEFRLREAYGEVDNSRLLGGDLLFGQTWSTYTNLYAVPNTLEFQAPNALFGTRHPMIRWTRPFGDGFKLKLALEAPDLRNFERHDSVIDSSVAGVNIQSESQLPDGVVALHYEKAPHFLSGALVLRDLRASYDTRDAGNGVIESGSDSTFGWGATLQGRVMMPEPLKEDYFQYSLVYGEGIGGVFNDVPPDAVYDVATNELKPLETFGFFVAYTHQWTEHFSSLATYAELHQDNEEVQLGSAFKKTRYSSLNLAWTPDPRWLLGVEVVYGSREDNDGATGSNVRTLLTTRFNY